MKVLVTGGSGFLGTHIVKALAEAGEEVINYSPSGFSEPAMAYLADLASRIHYVEGDVLDAGQFGRTLKSYQVECIVHAAAINGEPAARRCPERTLASNVMGTANVLTQAALARVRRVVYLGSGTQYGPRLDLRPLREEEPARPCGIYATTKQMAEMYGIEYANLFEVEFVSLRISAPYGPLEKIKPSPMHVQFWCRAALEGREVNLASGGDHPRDFTYVSDTARGVAAACRCEKLRYNIYNISSGRSYTLRELVEVVKRLRPGARLRIGEGFLAGDNPSFRTSLRGPLDISRTRNELGFSPEVDLVTGVNEYLEWLDENLW
ncbi:GDP-L-fucose synthase [Neomoorella glycerini]|uniref:GDP-L-fucose synthase n=1 Tax=Neomoorella glycerini TaxID=55779 RepID=A0A6I5ZMZ5_9FIRM|nr:NAD(P)-dependent oxidoreductase [Moorella glycerini]QGP90991.1 GDP-L-fucose synthase [Moorella glycerini]